MPEMLHMASPDPPTKANMAMKIHQWLLKYTLPETKNSNSAPEKLTGPQEESTQSSNHPFFSFPVFQVEKFPEPPKKISPETSA